MIAVALAASWEWAALCGRERMAAAGWVTVAATTLAVSLGALGFFALAPWIALAGALATGVLARRSAAGPWYGLAILYLSAACLAFIWLRQLPDMGRELVLWLVLVIWAADSGAYAAGRLIGGPKLAPRISPGKTWAGLVGGLLAAALVGGLLGLFQDSGKTVTLLLVAGALALVSQGGDLLESMLKRRFGAKDSGSLIPGHGGVLDRIDSLLLATLALAALVWLNEMKG